MYRCGWRESIMFTRIQCGKCNNRNCPAILSENVSMHIISSFSLYLLVIIPHVLWFIRLVLFHRCLIVDHFSVNIAQVYCRLCRILRKWRTVCNNTTNDLSLTLNCSQLSLSEDALIDSTFFFVSLLGCVIGVVIFFGINNPINEN